MRRILLFCEPGGSPFYDEIIESLKAYNRLFENNKTRIYDEAEKLREEIKLSMQLEREGGAAYLIILLLDGFGSVEKSNKTCHTALEGLTQQPILKIHLLNTSTRDPRFSESGTFSEYSITLLEHLISGDDEYNQLYHRPILLSNALERGAKLNPVDLGLQLYGILYSIRQDKDDKLLSFLLGNARIQLPILISCRVLVRLNQHHFYQSLNSIKNHFKFGSGSSKSVSEVLTFDTVQTGEVIEGDVKANYQAYLGIDPRQSGVCDKLIRHLNPVTATRAVYEIVRRQIVQVQRPVRSDESMQVKDRLGRQVLHLVETMEGLPAYDVKITKLRDAIFQNEQALEKLRTKGKKFTGFTHFKDRHDQGVQKLQLALSRLATLRKYGYWLKWRNIRPNNPIIFSAALLSVVVIIAALYFFFSNIDLLTRFRHWSVGVLSCVILGLAIHLIFYKIYIFILERGIQNRFKAFNEECRNNFGTWLEQKIQIFGNMNAMKLLRQRSVVFERFLARLSAFRQDLAESLSFLEALMHEKSLVAMVLDDAKRADIPFDLNTLPPPKPTLKIHNKLIADLDMDWKAYFVEMLTVVLEKQNDHLVDWLDNKLFDKIHSITLDHARGTRRQLSPPVNALEINFKESVDFLGPKNIFENALDTNSTNLMALDNDGKLAIHLCLSGVGETK